MRFSLAATLGSWLSLAVLSSAVRVDGTLLGPHDSPAAKDLSPNTRVVLSGGQYVATVKKDGKFFFPDVPVGSYALEVRSPQYTFPSVKLDVTEKGHPVASLIVLGTDWSGTGNLMPSPLTLQARSPTPYFMEREGFKISSLFANPMMLMMGFSVLMLFAMPKLMAGMDEEALSEVQGMQDAAAMPNFEMPDLAATLAKYTAGPSAAAPATNGKSKKQQ